MFAVGALLLGIGLVETWTDAVWHPNPWWHLLPLTVMCTLMALRRRAPLACLGCGALVFVGDGLAGGTLGTLLVFVELAYAAGRYGRGRMADYLGRLVFGIIIGLALVAFVITRDLRLSIMAGITVFTVVGTSYWWGESAKKQADLVEVERARAADLARMADLRAEQARRSEREAMAGELHDALSGNLAAITIHAEAALTNPRLAPEALELVRATSKQAMSEMRTLLTVLRPHTDVTLPPSRVQDAVEAARSRGLEVHTVYTPDPLGDLPIQVAHAAHRVVQEALANVHRHSPTARADVTVRTDNHLTIDVCSDGLGKPVAAHRGYGLTSMSERVQALGGHLTAGPDGGRWRVHAVVPLTAQPNEKEHL